MNKFNPKDALLREQKTPPDNAMLQRAKRRKLIQEQLNKVVKDKF